MGFSSSLCPSVPRVYQYTDYRAFLRDYYHAQKANSRGFSYRTFSERAGLRSPNFLKLVIEAKRNVSAGVAARIAHACGLRGQEALYFQDLVLMAQAKTQLEREQAYRRLLSFDAYHDAHKLESAHVAYHAEWYIPAVCELANRRDFCADPAWIAGKMVPRITTKQAKHALKTLDDLEFLKTDKDGRLRPAHAVRTTGELAPIHLRLYHKASMQQALASIDAVDAADRDISAVTLCIDAADTFDELRACIQKFRRELLSVSTRQTDPKRVVQVNIQLFPMSEKE